MARSWPPRILHGDTKKSVHKALEMGNNSSEIPHTKGQLTRAVIDQPEGPAQGRGVRLEGQGQADAHRGQGTAKGREARRVDVTWSGEIAKANDDKQQIFGWASVVEVNGEPVVDLQGDAITAEEMEKAGYEYVMKSRKGGDMHLRDNWSPIQKSEMIESFIVTDEKRDAMGLPSRCPDRLVGGLPGP